MLRTIVCSALLACASSAHAADWQKEFFTSMTNELPASRGVVVDDAGYVHLQSFNKQPWSAGYEMAHLRTIDAQGRIPWIWGLSQVDRKSDCGVFASSGQRLDCFLAAGYDGDGTRLEMRGRDNGYVVWQARLPSNVELLDAGIPSENVAVFVARLRDGTNEELGVFRAGGYGTVDVLAVANACPDTDQRMSMSRFRMPGHAGDTIRHIKACWNSYGTTDLILEEFDIAGGQWTTLSVAPIAYGTQLLRAEINPQGKAFAMTEERDGSRMLLLTPNHADHWEQLPFPVDGRIAAFLAGPQGLVVVAQPDQDILGSLQFDTMAYTSLQVGGTPTATWLDLDAPYWPVTHRLHALNGLSPQGYALSSEGNLIVVGADTTQQNAQSVWQADRYGQSHWVASLPTIGNEAVLDKTYVLGGPGNVAIVARTLDQHEGYGEPQTGVRVNQYDLPPSP